MSTPAEQLQTINKNLAAAIASGDQQKIESLQKSKLMSEALNAANEGTAPSGTTPSSQGGFSTTLQDGTKYNYDANGVQTSITPPPEGMAQSSASGYSNPASQLEVRPFGAPTATDYVGPTNTNNKVTSFGTPTATDVVGPTNTDNRVQAFGTPTATDVVGPTNTDTEVKPFGTPTATDYVGPTNTDTEVRPFGQVAGDTAATGEVAPADSLAPGEEIVPVNPDEDPFEARRLQNIEEGAADERPAGEKIISAEDDSALLTNKEKSDLEEQQANNRAQLKKEEAAADGAASGNVASSVDSVRAKPAMYVQRNTIQKDDWRLRLSLATTANYLYKAGNIKPSDILYPLAGTDGVVFPYTPQINSAYRANYDPAELTHSNYKMFFYKNSSVDDISITADFTAQDTAEANYLLAVIHFFKSVTKMFYGQDGKDGGPSAGTPPPLCYLNGLGAFQYSEHPVLITSFSYNLPNDVDYIRAGSTTQLAGQNVSSYKTTKADSGWNLMSLLRSKANNLTKGAVSKDPVFSNLSNSAATYVPTKIQITLTLLPVVTRNDISKNFSLSDYATGKLSKGSQRNGGGIW